jgi:hypothetical protein
MSSIVANSLIELIQDSKNENLFDHDCIMEWLNNYTKLEIYFFIFLLQIY